MHTDDAVGGVLALLLIGYVLTALLFPSSSDGHQLMGSTTAFLIATAVLFAALAAAYVPLGDHMARAFTSPRHLRVERLVYRAGGVDPEADQTWATYLRSLLIGLRAWTTVPVLVLSARRDTTDKVRALDAGADDYLAKPFAMDELLARLRAAARRGAAAVPEQAVVETAAFTVDLARSLVLRDGQAVHLTPTEWRLMEVLARHVGRLVGQRQLLQEVWGPAYETETNYLRIYLAKLRKKLEPEPSRPRHLLTEPGLSVRLQP